MQKQRAGHPGVARRKFRPQLILAPPATLALSLALPSLGLQPRFDRPPRRPSPLPGLWHRQGTANQVREPLLGVLAVLPLTARIARDHPDHAVVAHSRA